MLLIPFLYHHVGLPLTVLLAAAMIGCRIALRGRGGRAGWRSRRPMRRSW